jgi:hypothetical protein
MVQNTFGSLITDAKENSVVILSKILRLLA